MANIRPLSPALAEKARLELNEDSKRVADDIKHLKDWIAKQPYLRARTDDQWLLTFLRGCKFSLERTKEKLDLYYSMRSTAPEMYKLKHTDPLFEEILDLGTLIILPKVASPDAPRITLIRPENYCSNKYSVFDMMAVSHIIQKIVLMEDDNATVAGSVSVLDLENVTMSILVQMTPTTLKKIVVAGQDALPLRLKGAHFLNTPSWFETAFNTTKSLLSEKNRKRVYVHNNNIDSLYEYVPKDILPTEYGGNGGSINEILAYWKNKVKEYSDFLEEDMQFGTDETKRPDKPKTAEEMFGAEGSFRKLEFD